MCEEKHTPGPWEWRNNKYGELRLFGPDNATVIGVDDQCSTTKNEAHVATWNDADARLIAAAPDLLAACKLIAAMAVGWEPLTPGDIAEVTAAIAKAEGF